LERAGAGVVTVTAPSLGDQLSGIATERTSHPG
jgi:hypothetical protein